MASQPSHTQEQSAMAGNPDGSQNDTGNDLIDPVLQDNSQIFNFGTNFSYEFSGPSLNPGTAPQSSDTYLNPALFQDSGMDFQSIAPYQDAGATGQLSTNPGMAAPNPIVDQNFMEFNWNAFNQDQPASSQNLTGNQYDMNFVGDMSVLDEFLVDSQPTVGSQPTADNQLSLENLLSPGPQPGTNRSFFEEQYFAPGELDGGVAENQLSSEVPFSLDPQLSNDNSSFQNQSIPSGELDGEDDGSLFGAPEGDDPNSLFDGEY
ncbi:hypothetical protein Hte_009817 [Hypoxylon texense]